ncbi:hypothetical protein Tco_1054890 [Tanacetum coccineum]|uniref:Uncharacterized protein n=1 Tax=Tanacetum coccineum TaxID=301880 RepID=A0ABQ5GY33_9ASTR
MMMTKTPPLAIIPFYQFFPPPQELDNSLCNGGTSILDTVSATVSEQVIKISVETCPIPSESEGFLTKCVKSLCENTTPLNALNEHSEIVVNSNDDNSLSDDDSPYGEDIDYVDASPPNVEIVSLEVVEIVESEIDALRDNLTPSSDIKSSYAVPHTHSELLLPDYKAFYVDNDHFKEKSSGSTTTHVDFSRYNSFIFDLSNDQFPPADRSDLYHEEFADELAHIMSLPNLECFKFKIEPDPGDLASIDPGIRKNVSTTNVNVPLEDDQSSLFAYVVWIFLAFLTYPVYHIGMELHEVQWFNPKPLEMKVRLMILFFQTVCFPMGPTEFGMSSRACDSVNKNKALRGWQPMLIQISQIVKTLVLAVLPFIHKSFTSSASFWESNIQI